MATVAHSTVNIPINGLPRRLTVWTPITNANNDGSWVDTSTLPDRCIQVSGTFGSGSLSIEGTNDTAIAGVILSDTFGLPMTFTAAGIKQVAQCPRFIRPLLTGGSSTSLTVSALAVS